MKATKTLIASAIVAASIAAPAMAEESLSLNAAVSSDYVWRGMTQTAGQAAVSGGIDYDAGNGVYVGTWFSNVEFADASYEADIYAGYAGKAGDFDYDVGYVYYGYFDGTDLDFSEVYGSVTYDFVTAGVAILVDAEGADFADTFYYNLDGAWAVEGGFELGAHIGYYDVDGADEQIDYSISLSKGAFTLTMSDTDADDGSDADPKFFVSYSLDL